MPLTNQTLIFLPVLALAALTYLAFFRMASGRAAAVKSGHDPAFYRAHIGAPEPEAAAAGARHWDNLFELPTVVYAACIVAFVLGAVGTWTLVFAWAYVALRLVQSLVHMSYNNPTHRGIAFSLGVVASLTLWINVGLAVIERV